MWGGHLDLSATWDPFVNPSEELQFASCSMRIFEKQRFSLEVGSQFHVMVTT